MRVHDAFSFATELIEKKWHPSEFLLDIDIIHFFVLKNIILKIYEKFNLKWQEDQSHKRQQILAADLGFIEDLFYGHIGIEG